MQTQEITPYKFIEKKDLAVIYKIAFQIPIPTEFVIAKPEYCIPYYARVFYTTLYLLNDQVIDYPTLAQERLFKGTNYYDAIYLVEVWQDQGNDGHVDYNHKGYRFVPKSTFDKETKYNILDLHGEGKLPNCMRDCQEYDVNQSEIDKKAIERLTNVTENKI